MDVTQIYLVGYFISWILIAGMACADEQAERYYHSKDFRKTLGFAIGWSALISVLWPVGLPLFFCITGFAEHGWSLSNRKED